MDRAAPISDLRLVAKLTAWRTAATGIVIAIPCAVLVGWMLEIEVLKRVLPLFTAMNPVTAVILIIAGCGFALVERRGIARACSLAPGVAGALVLGKYLFGWDSGIDLLLFPGSVGKNVMSPTTALNFVLVGSALWLLAAPHRDGDRWAQGFAFAVAAMSLLALTGYAYGVEELYRLAAFKAMAVHTAICFLALATGLLCIHPEGGSMERFTSARAGGLMLRRVLLPTVVVPLALGWLILQGLRTGLLAPSFAFTVMVVAVIVFLVSMIWRSAALLDAEDARGAEAEGELREAHGALEDAVRARTGELEHTVDGIRDGLHVLGSASEKIVTSGSALAALASETATSVAETTAAVEESRQTARLASQGAVQVAASARKAAQLSSAGTEATRATTEGMDRIRSEMRALGERMVQLSNQTRAIGVTIAAVDELAGQSSLLAVNAAIEAALAGEHGKGFSIVAQEVRYLSEQSRRATHHVRTILHDIQQATDAAVMMTEKATGAVEAGALQAARAGEAILGLEASAEGAAHVAAEIAASHEQQLISMDHVALAMDQIKSASIANVVEARRLEAATVELNTLGQHLTELAGQHQT